MAKTDVGMALTDDRTKDVWICKKILVAARDGKIHVYTSMLTIAECLFVTDDNKQKVLTDDVKRLFEGMLTSGKSGVVPVQPDIFVIEQTKNLAWNHGIWLKPLDNLHIGSAIHYGCKEFLTYDRRIGEMVRRDLQLKFGLSVIRPFDTQLLPNEYRQESI